MSTVNETSATNVTIEPRLQYNYAKINLPSGLCTACGTFSYQVPLENYIEVPYATNDYAGKYYDFYGTKMWYHDELFQNLWEECPSHNI